MADLVLIDTCIWVPFFARKKSLHKSAAADLLDPDRAATIGPILAEVLLGFTKDTEADWVASALAGVQYVVRRNLLQGRTFSPIQRGP